MKGRLTVTVALVGALIGLAACGGGSATRGARGDAAIPFDVHRRLARVDAQALTALSSTVAQQPATLTMGDGMVSEPAHPIAFDDAETRQRFTAQLRQAGRAAHRYATAAAALANGYVLASYFVSGFGVHWVKWSLVDRPFDPAQPAMLLFDGEGTDAHLVALSYYVRSEGPPEGFAGANDQWHRHFGDCYAGGFVIGEQIRSADICAKIGEARAAGVIHAPVGTPEEAPGIEKYLRQHTGPAAAPTFASNLVAGTDLWMLHAWVGPGPSNPWGTFATANPTLTRCVGSCRPASR